jgi:hypothetical protein
VKVKMFSAASRDSVGGIGALIEAHRFYGAAGKKGVAVLTSLATISRP